MTRRFDRRSMIGGAAALGAGVAMPAIVRAQSKTLVAATFPGTWNEADRNIISPAFKAATGAAVTQSIVLGTDQVARLTAAKGNKPPFDVAFFDTPQVLDAVKEGLIVEYPAGKSPNFTGLIPKFQDKWGPKITMQASASATIPRRSRRRRRAGTSFGTRNTRAASASPRSTVSSASPSSLSSTASRAAARTDFEPAFKALKSLLPNVGAIGANLGAFATLWQQEQVDIAPYNFNFVQTLKAKRRAGGARDPGHRPGRLSTPAHAYRRRCRRARTSAAAYIDAHLDPARCQAAMQKPPYDVIPTNSKVALEGAVTKSIARTYADLAKVRRLRLGEASIRNAAP